MLIKSLFYIYREDLISSAMLASRPQFEPSPFSHLTKEAPVYAELLSYSPAQEDSFRDPLLTIYHQLRHLTLQTSQPCSLPDFTETSSTDPDPSLSGLRFSVGQYLESLSPASTNPINNLSDDFVNFSSDTVYTFEAHRLAALIYVHLLLDAHPTTSLILQSLKDRLITTIKSAEGPHPCLKPRRRSALWVCFLGGLASANACEKMWFAERITRIMRKIGFESWEDVELNLREVCWADTLMRIGEVGNRMWQNVCDIRARGLERCLPDLSAEFYPPLKVAGVN